VAPVPPWLNTQQSSPASIPCQLLQFNSVPSCSSTRNAESADLRRVVESNPWTVPWDWQSKSGSSQTCGSSIRCWLSLPTPVGCWCLALQGCSKLQQAGVMQIAVWMTCHSFLDRAATASAAAATGRGCSCRNAGPVAGFLTAPMTAGNRMRQCM